jgi:WD40 repeat protein
MANPHKQLIPKGNLQQVSLDPSSLKFISDIITERINHEFALRDGRLIEKVKTMITSTTAPNSSVALRYDDRNGHNHLTSGVETPQRNRPHSTSSGPSLPHAPFMESGMSSSIASKSSLGAHPSRIPVRVSLPKIASAVAAKSEARAEHGDHVQGGMFANPRAPSGSRSGQGSAPARRLSHGHDARLPHLASAPALAAAAQAPSRIQKVSSHDDVAAAHHPSGSMVEPVLDGIQYPQCRSKVYGPSYAVEAPDPLPGAKLALHHVYGYDGDPNRHGSAVRGKNVLWIDARRVIYPAAAVVVVQEVGGDHRQGFFCGHSDDVTCVAVHPQHTVAASGQMGKDGSVLVWDLSKIKRGMSVNRHIAKLKPAQGVRGISAVDFSGDGRLVLGVGLDESRLLMIFDWKEGTMVASARIGHSDLNQVRFNPFLFSSTADPTTAQSAQSSNSQKSHHNDTTCKSCYTLVSFGGKNIKFWTLKESYVKDESGLESISTFKGRPLNKRKGDQSGSMKFTLEGNLGVVTSKGNAPTPDFTSMVMVNDSHGGSDFGRGFVRDTPKSRIFCATSTGSIYIWQQLEDDGMRASLEKVNNGGLGAGAAPVLAWQPRGKLLSVVMELHDAPIIDMDFIRVPPVHDHQHPPEQAGRVESRTERIITSSSDGIVNVWMLSRHQETSNAVPLDHLGYIELNKEYARSVSWDPTGTAAVLGTAENSVLLMSYEEEAVPPSKDQRVSTEDLIRPKIAISVVTQAHNGKVRKLAMNPVISSLVATISSEKVVRIWDFRERVLLSRFEVPESATAVAFTSGGDALVLGTEKGELTVYTCASLRQLAQSYPCAFTVDDFRQAEWSVVFQRSLASKLGKCCLLYDSVHRLFYGADWSQSCVPVALENGTPSKKKPAHTKKAEVCEIVFSPTGDTVAVACKDNLVHLLTVGGGYKHLAVCRGHSAHVRTMDFSRDGAVLQTSDASRELMYWDAASGKRLLNAAQFRDEAWSTYNSVYGWSVQGVFNNSEGN